MDDVPIIKWMQDGETVISASWFCDGRHESKILVEIGKDWFHIAKTLNGRWLNDITLGSEDIAALLPKLNELFGKDNE